MPYLLTTLKENVQWIVFNRPEKHNAFDDHFLRALHTAIIEAEANHDVKAIVLKAQGKHFSAGADIQWMKRMVHFSEAENEADARLLADTLHAIYACAKPTIAMVQGAAYGGGAGLVAACDIAIAAHGSQFCFSEVKLGLIPAVISPYVIRAIGERAAAWLFMSAEIIDATRAQALHLIHQSVADDALETYTESFVSRLTQLPPDAVREAKALVRRVAYHPIDIKLKQLTASLIAKKRVSKEGQLGLQAFLNKDRA